MSAVGLCWLGCEPVEQEHSTLCVYTKGCRWDPEMWRCLTLPAGSIKLLSGQARHHHFSMVKFYYFGFNPFWVPVVTKRSKTNVPEPRTPLKRQALQRKFALPPVAARYQRTPQNRLQFHLTTGTQNLQTSAVQSGESTEQCLKLHPLCGTGLILWTAGVDGDSLWGWLEPKKKCKCLAPQLGCTTEDPSEAVKAATVPGAHRCWSLWCCPWKPQQRQGSLLKKVSNYAEQFSYPPHCVYRPWPFWEFLQHTLQQLIPQQVPWDLHQRALADCTQSCWTALWQWEFKHQFPFRPSLSLPNLLAWGHFDY